MEIVQVDLGQRSYPIYIGQGLFGDSELLCRHIKATRIMLVSNTTVAPLYLDKVTTQLTRGGKLVDQVILPDGEAYKTLATLETIYDALLSNKHGRDTCIVALGGGVIGDMAGFAAACYQRGVDFIQIPTTLLSQVDSSVGGKTAVNHPLGKNMIGAFYQPQAVYIDIDCLKTLPSRELAAGMAEVIKYGIIWDEALFARLEQDCQALLALDETALAQVIRRCCEIKAEVVAEDETEKGVRALLNLGHTFGHAIEAEQGYGNWLHGEAVAAGMVMAASTSVLRGLITPEAKQRIEQLISAFDLPTQKPAEMGYDAFIEHMALDKKVLAGKLRFVLPTAIGQAALFSDVEEQQLRQIVESA